MNRQEQINKVQELLSSGLLSENAKKALIEDFSELAESEDERIRKKILAEYKDRLAIASIEYKNPLCNKEIVDFLEKAIAYLEKQKEDKDELVYHLNGLMQAFYKAGRDEEEKEHRFKCYKLFWDALEDAEFFEQKEQKSVVPLDDELQRHQDELYDFKVFAAKQAKKHHISFIHDFEWNNFCAEILSYLNGQQQPAEWSEEDLQHKSWILECLADGKRTMPQYAADFHAAYNWLKSLHPQPKAELTLLDKNIINAAVAFVEQNDHFNVWGGIDKHTVIKALRSLKPHWKPSLATADLENNLCDIQDNYHDGSHEYKVLGEAIEFIRSTESHWKPSEEQINALNCAIQTMRYQLNLGDKRLLSLYNDLKKLM